MSAASVSAAPKQARLPAGSEPRCPSPRLGASEKMRTTWFRSTKQCRNSGRSRQCHYAAGP